MYRYGLYAKVPLSHHDEHCVYGVNTPAESHLLALLLPLKLSTFKLQNEKTDKQMANGLPLATRLAFPQANAKSR